MKSRMRCSISSDSINMFFYSFFFVYSMGSLGGHVVTTRVICRLIDFSIDDVACT